MGAPRVLAALCLVSALGTARAHEHGETCVDDPDWAEMGAAFKTCAWMATRIESSWPTIAAITRCNSFMSADGVLAIDACCETCAPFSFMPTSAPTMEAPTGLPTPAPTGLSCVDDPEWAEMGAAFKTCAWMADKIATSWPPISAINRCNSFTSVDGVLAIDACCETCAPFAA